jgi:hypothetical protein
MPKSCSNDLRGGGLVLASRQTPVVQEPFHLLRIRRFSMETKVQVEIIRPKHQAAVATSCGGRTYASRFGAPTAPSFYGFLNEFRVWKAYRRCPRVVRLRSETLGESIPEQQPGANLLGRWLVTSSEA